MPDFYEVKEFQLLNLIKAGKLLVIKVFLTGNVMGKEQGKIGNKKEENTKKKMDRCILLGVDNNPQNKPQNSSPPFRYCVVFD